MIILLGSKSNTTLRFLADSAATQNFPVWHLDLLDLTQDLKIQTDIGQDGTTSTTWTWREQNANPHSVRSIVNFINGSLEDYFTDFDPADRTFAEAEFTAALSHSLTQFRNVYNLPGAGRLGGWCDSLPLQWDALRSLAPHLGVPTFYAGRAANAPDHLKNQEDLIVTTGIYEIAQWKPNRPNIKPDDWVLAYRRPKGVPVIVTTLDNETWVSTWQSAWTTTLRKELDQATTQLASFFGLRLATSLFFVDREGVTFGSLGPEASIKYIGDLDRVSFARRIMNA